MRKPKEILYVRISPEAMKVVKKIEKKLKVSRSKAVELTFLGLKFES